MSGYILVLLIIGVFLSLMAGVILMGKGGKANKKYGNKLMMSRVVFQGLIVLVLIIMFIMGEK